jgi:hypothetical protein
MGLLTSITLAAIVGHHISTVVPQMIAGALLFLTPIYFLLSLLGSMPLASDRLAIIFGLALGAPVYLLAPGIDLLLTGLVGGTLAYGLARFMAARGADG